MQVSLITIFCISKSTINGDPSRFFGKDFQILKKKFLCIFVCMTG